MKRGIVTTLQGYQTSGLALLIGLFILLLIGINLGMAWWGYNQFQNELLESQAVMKNTLQTTVDLHIQELSFLKEALARNRNYLQVTKCYIQFLSDKTKQLKRCAKKSLGVNSEDHSPQQLNELFQKHVADEAIASYSYFIGKNKHVKIFDLLFEGHIIWRQNAEGFQQQDIPSMMLSQARQEKKGLFGVEKDENGAPHLFGIFAHFNPKEYYFSRIGIEFQQLLQETLEASDADLVIYKDLQLVSPGMRESGKLDRLSFRTNFEGQLDIQDGYFVFKIPVPLFGGLDESESFLVIKDGREKIFTSLTNTGISIIQIMAIVILMVTLLKMSQVIRREIQKLEESEHSLANANTNLSKLYGELEKVKNTFQKFVPEKFLQRIAKQGIDSIKLGTAESDNITILFSDVRSFTSLSETMTPQEILNFLNAYLKRMSSPIVAHHGFVDKFIGDAIMALFDQPHSTINTETHAVNAALSMFDELQLYNQHRQKTGYAPISIGVGIHSGPVVIGTIGSEDRMDSTVLGDSVNLASRLEGLTKQYASQIIISSNVHDLLADDPRYLLRELDFVSVKGKEEPIRIYEIFNHNSDNIRDWKQEMMPLYSEGLAGYHMRQWDDSIQCFQQCLHIFPDDSVSQMYLKRALHYKTNPPADDWNGAVILGQK